MNVYSLPSSTFQNGLAIRPSLYRKRTRAPAINNDQPQLGLGLGRLRFGADRPDVRCHTLEQEDLGVHLGAINGTNGTALPKNKPQTNEAFQQLRQAVLSSLDFSDTVEHASDIEDTAYDSSVDEISVKDQSASTVGKALYEALRIDPAGKTRRYSIKRRELIRRYGLQPRDLRRVDPSLGLTKTSPSVTLKDNCILINIGGIRAVIAADRCLLFEPNSTSSRKFVELVTPRLQASAAERSRRSALSRGPSTNDEYTSTATELQPGNVFPMELELLEGALMVATGKLESELVAATKRVVSMSKKLPRDITPVNLEELRRIKQFLVELESKSENLRSMLEELLDDEDEVRELNLSSRPIREERRRQREFDRLEREAERGGASLRTTDYFSGTTISEFAPQSQQVQPLLLTDNNSSTAMKQSMDAEGTTEDLAVQEAQDALEELREEEEQERELEEVEDLLEYYLQRAATMQSEAERYLEGARDLEESIGVSLSARRFEVNRLELLLSIASFAAALGAMVASIFGMNLRSTLEMSVIGFWGTTAAIVVGCGWVFWVLYKYTKNKRIL